MKREDLRVNIIPTTIENSDQYSRIGDATFDTTDLVFLDSREDMTFIDRYRRRKSATDFAQMNNVSVDSYFQNFLNNISEMLLRSSRDGKIDSISVIGHFQNYFSSNKKIGICPRLHYKLPENSYDLEHLDIKEEKYGEESVLFHTLQIGEYPRTIVNDELREKLEDLYNGGDLRNGLICTGRWYSGNGEYLQYIEYKGKHYPEFEYEGNRYARVMIHLDGSADAQYSDGSYRREYGVEWVKVEPLLFEIINWDEMPKTINPNGNGKAEYFDLREKEIIIGNIPFYPDEGDMNNELWQNSSARGFLNGIDVRNIKENGNPLYTASRGGDFTGECNFLNEAFNLSREPMVEYSIPDSETQIPKDAFNGCLTLKKLLIHPKVNYIGEKAFEGLNFKYVYNTPNGELVLAQELPEKDEEYNNLIELDKIKNIFYEFDYNIFLHIESLDELKKLIEVLNKSKLQIPFIYADELAKKGRLKALYENSDFTFFKNENYNLQERLNEFPEEEQLDFFKFAYTLGCFSKEKLLDKNGNRTEKILAQKASSTLSQLLKIQSMALRKIS